MLITPAVDLPSKSLPLFVPLESVCYLSTSSAIIFDCGCDGFISLSIRLVFSFKEYLLLSYLSNPPFRIFFVLYNISNLSIPLFAVDFTAHLPLLLLHGICICFLNSLFFAPFASLLFFLLLFLLVYFYFLFFFSIIFGALGSTSSW